MSAFVTSSEIFDRLHAAGVIADDPSTVRRVVIDLQAGAVGRVYVELFADREQLFAALDAGIDVEVIQPREVSP